MSVNFERSASYEGGDIGKEWSVGLPNYFEYIPGQEDHHEEEQVEEQQAAADKTNKNKNDKQQENGNAKTEPESNPSSLDNLWTNPPAKLFSVRGPHYLEQTEKNNLQYKQPSAPCAYQAVGLNVFKGPVQMGPAAVKLECLRNYLEEGVDEVEGDAPQYLVFSWLFNNFFRTEYVCVVQLFKRKIRLGSDIKGDDEPLNRAFTRFLKADADTKNKKLKFACKIREATTALRTAVDMLGGERPVIMGKRLTTTYVEGKNFLEIDMDVGSSQIGSMLYGIVAKAAGVLQVDFSFLVEGQETDELPERILALCRWNRCDMNIVSNETDDEGKVVRAAEPVDK